MAKFSSVSYETYLSYIGDTKSGFIRLYINITLLYSNTALMYN